MCVCVMDRAIVENFRGAMASMRVGTVANVARTGQQSQAKLEKTGTLYRRPLPRIFAEKWRARKWAQSRISHAPLKNRIQKCRKRKRFPGGHEFSKKCLGSLAKK